MIKVNIYRNKNNNIYGFKLSGHAGFAEEGSDIVCSAVTVLVFNTINCIEEFTDEPFECDLDEKKGGFIDYCLTDIKSGKENKDADILLRAMVRGLSDIELEYGSYISINDEEVR